VEPTSDLATAAGDSAETREEPALAPAAPGTASERDLSVVEIRGGRGGLSRATLRELYDFREVLWAFVLRTVKVKYKQATVGIGWAVLQPLLSAAVFSLVLGHFAKVPRDGISAPVFFLCGMVPWTYFSGATGTAMESVIRDAALVRKIYFPREILPISAVLAALVDLVPGVVVLAIVATLYGYTPGIEWIAMPLPILLLVTTALAAGLLPSALNVFYRDVRLALPFFLQVGLFASAVIYPLSQISQPWRTVWGIANPVVTAIDSVRRIVAHGTWPQPGMLAGALAWSLILVVASYWGFKRMERSFADRV
jgi:lipopolysaccharide transport system permease protein